MRILVACEESQAVTIAFRALGHEAYSCDILPCSGGHPEWHYQGDVVPVLNEKWDMIVAFPPCTFLSHAGARWLYPKKELNQERYKKGLEAKEFFMLFYNHQCPKIAIENPMPSRIYDLPKHNQEIQPWQFGDEAQKRTLLWLKGLPPLLPSEIVGKGEFMMIKGYKHKSAWFNSLPPSPERAKLRAKTFPGIARAMAEQWGTERAASMPQEVGQKDNIEGVETHLTTPALCNADHIKDC